jgi:hypothetical protein
MANVLLDTFMEMLEINVVPFSRVDTETVISPGLMAVSKPLLLIVAIAEFELS